MPRIDPFLACFRINQLCDRFESLLDQFAHTAGDNGTGQRPIKPNVADFLNDVAADQPIDQALHDQLAIELLMIELEHDRTITLKKLAVKYPDLSHVIQYAVGAAEVEFGDSAKQLQLPIEEALHQSLPTAHQPTTPSPSSSPLPFGRYQLTHRLGAGGFGVVFRAYDSRMKRDVAIKIPRLSLIDDESARARLEQEVEALAKLNHPGIATAYNAEEIEGYFSLVFEFVDGANLEQWLGPERAMPVATAVKLAMQICDALDHAHSLGIVHLDIKPSNILVLTSDTSEPIVKLVDFGLAKSIASETVGTTTSMAIGTLPYMSPEQLLRSQSVGFTSDIYAVGVVLHRLLSGQPPFHQKNEPELMAAILDVNPKPLTDPRLNISKSLAAIVSKCLMKRPADRYQTAGNLRHDLQNALQHKPISARTFGYAERLRQWCRGRSRIVQAGAFSLIFNCTMAFWSLVVGGAVIVSGAFAPNVGPISLREFYLSAISLLIVSEAPLIWAAVMSIRRRAFAAYAGLALSLMNFTCVLLVFIGALPPGFGGLYENVQTRLVAYSLILSLMLVQAFLYAVACYSNQFRMIHHNG